MKVLRLTFHQQNGSTSSNLLFNKADLPEAKTNDVLEISQVINDQTIKILVKVPEISDSSQPISKGNISLSKVAGKKFGLRNLSEVSIKTLTPEELEGITLQHVELVFKDQYYSRSDMLRMRSSLMSDILFQEQKIELLQMKAQVEELWCNGTRVSCGFITKETRVSFRSSSAQVHIFIQMSCEMWQFDDYGQLYLEKAVDGYLYDLFKLWKDKSCAHDVSITLFSRTFYDARSLDEFPPYMRECICEDYAGRFYEDYYRVVVQNERYDDWFKTIDHLKKLFTTYDMDVLHFHDKQGQTNRQDLPWNPRAAMGLRRERASSNAGEKSSLEEDYGEFLKVRSRRKSINVSGRPPLAWNSTASEGNLLEVINMALNVYEKFYMDRCFERTGKMSIVITPGLGVFDVDRDLMNITKQRSIDIGSCCDLVCLGQRPLFAVPLFKINQDRMQNFSLVDEDYNVPHWLNLSYYTSRAQMESQIQGKTMLNSDLLEAISACSANDGKSRSLEDSLRNESHYENSSMKGIKDDMPIINYEDYDSKVFKYHSKAEQQEKFSYLLHKSSRAEYGERRQRVTYTIAANGLFADQPQRKSANIPIAQTKREENTEDFLSHSFGGKLPEEDGHSVHCRRMAGSVTFPYCHFRRLGHFTPSKSRSLRSTSKALVNPFFPSKLNFKATSNRRRWAHAYPVESCITQQIKPFARGNASPSRESLFSDSSNLQQTTPATLSRMYKQRKHNLSECSEQGFNPGSYVESPSKGHIRYESLCIGESAANILLGKQFPHTESSSSLGSSCNDIFGSFGRSRVGLSCRLAQQTSRHSQLIHDKEVASHSCKIAGLDPLLPVYDKLDWKSMTIAPILPITTDYFPDRQTLEQHYLFSEYTLVAEEIEVHFSGVYGSRHTPTLAEVFNEMIYHRVAQGFQIVIMPKVVPPQQSTQSFRKPAFHKSPSLPATPSMTEEVVLSMGRMFHKLTLHEKDIVVRRYTPRHSLNRQCSYDYSYRFHVPDSLNFDSSYTCFKTDPLDTYNWNYVDHHLLAQGCQAKFLETLKFWRTRFVLMPSVNPGSKKILEEGSQVCNVYEPKGAQEKQLLVEKFLKFVEYVNGIQKERRKNSLGPMVNIFSNGNQKKEFINLSQNIQTHHFHKNGEPSQQHLSKLQGIELSQSMSHSEVIKAMMDPNNGLICVVSPLNWIIFPKNSFIASDAVFWLMKFMDGINSVSKAVQYMQDLISAKLVCHASYRYDVPFVFGYKIFFFVSEDHIEDLEMGLFIEKNFIEVEILPGVEEENQARRRNTQPASSLKEIRAKKAQGANMFSQSQFRNVRMEIESSSSRQEWGVLRHHELYTPTCAFEVYIEWLVATGSTLGERILGWTKKACSFGLSFVPVPCDPFALSSIKQSDPLRGPIYIPMDVDCLEGPRTNDHEWSNINHSLLLNFQDYILKSFGFMREKCVTAPTLSEDCMISKQTELPKYIHCSGGMHIMVVSTLSRKADFGKTDTKGIQYEDYIIRQYNQQVPQCKPSKSVFTHTVGFLWAWNFMLTKKWSSHANDFLHDRILADMRRFCSNSNNRMKLAWDQFKKSIDYMMFS